MPNVKTFDLKFTPRSYWGPQSLGAHFGSRIKGEVRRRVALEELEQGQCAPGTLASSLNAAEAQAAGQIHPWLMGGEYLPNLLPNEVEIARVTLKSTTMDVTSIRARQLKGKVAYRIVDEYMEPDDERFKLSPKTSKSTLPMQKLIDLIEANDLVSGPREHNQMWDFATVFSAFYPDLARWYDEGNEEWRQRHPSEDGSDD